MHTGAFNNEDGPVSTVSSASDTGPSRLKPKANKMNPIRIWDRESEEESESAMSGTKRIESVHARPKTNENGPGYARLCDDREEPKYAKSGIGSRNAIRLIP